MVQRGGEIMATMMTRFGAAGVFLALVLAAAPEGGAQQPSSALQSYQPVTAERLTKPADGDC